MQFTIIIESEELDSDGNVLNFIVNHAYIIKHSVATTQKLDVKEVCNVTDVKQVGRFDSL
jgi:hypothetical protein